MLPSKRALHRGGFAQSEIEAALGVQRDRPGSLASPFATQLPQAATDLVPALDEPIASAKNYRKSPVPPPAVNPSDCRRAAPDNSEPDRPSQITTANPRRRSLVAVHRGFHP